MSCFHPMKGFIVGIKDNGKKDIKIRDYEVDHIELLRNGQYIDRPARDVPLVGRPFYSYDLIPCGRCDGCRLQHAKALADRAVLELQDHDSNYFLTLTYNDNDLPVNKFGYANLNKKDLQDFWKRLRERIAPKKIRYLACGEYGDQTFRSHYHAVVFGLEIDDLIPWQHNEYGDWLYRSEFIEDVWKHGNVLIGKAEYENIAYVARYTTKKLYGKEGEYYEENDLVPPFITMSRRPGLGRNYYEKHKDELFKEGRYFFFNGHGVSSSTPGRYFNNLFEGDFGVDAVSERKQHLKQDYLNRNKSKLSRTDKDYLDMLKSEEYSLSKKIIINRSKV